MMHHREKRPRTGLWFAAQLIAWAVVMAAVLALVTGCKSTEPGQGETPAPGPTFVRERLSEPVCGRCFERPELGHAS